MKSSLWIQLKELVELQVKAKEDAEEKRGILVKAQNEFETADKIENDLRTKIGDMFGFERNDGVAKNILPSVPTLVMTDDGRLWKVVPHKKDDKMTCSVSEEPYIKKVNT